MYKIRLLWFTLHREVISRELYSWFDIYKHTPPLQRKHHVRSWPNLFRDFSLFAGTLSHSASFSHFCVPTFANARHTALSHFHVNALNCVRFTAVLFQVNVLVLNQSATLVLFVISLASWVCTRTLRHSLQSAFDQNHPLELGLSSSDPFLYTVINNISRSSYLPNSVGPFMAVLQPEFTAYSPIRGVYMGLTKFGVSRVYDQLNASWDTVIK